MYKKRLSEKIARVFEIAGYILLIPTIPMVVVSAIFIFPLLISVPLFTIGLVLLIGYAKHSRGKLDESKVVILWIATFLFNVLPLLYTANQFYSYPNIMLESLNFVSVPVMFWWITACCLSLTAFYDDFIQGKSKFWVGRMS